MRRVSSFIQWLVFCSRGVYVTCWEEQKTLFCVPLDVCACFFFLVFSPFFARFKVFLCSKNVTSFFFYFSLFSFVPSVYVIVCVCRLLVVRNENGINSTANWNKKSCAIFRFGFEENSKCYCLHIIYAVYVCVCVFVAPKLCKHRHPKLFHFVFAKAIYYSLSFLLCLCMHKFAAATRLNICG